MLPCKGCCFRARPPHLPIPGHRAQPPCPPLTPQVQPHLSPVDRTVPVLSLEAPRSLQTGADGSDLLLPKGTSKPHGPVFE